VLRQGRCAGGAARGASATTGRFGGGVGLVVHAGVFSQEVRFDLVTVSDQLRAPPRGTATGRTNGAVDQANDAQLCLHVGSLFSEQF
jgi:hypothetical protein